MRLLGTTSRMTATVSGASLAVKCQQNPRTVVRTSRSNSGRNVTQSSILAHSASFRAGPLCAKSLRAEPSSLGPGYRCSGHFIGVERLRRSKKVTGVRRQRGTHCASNGKESESSSSEPSVEANLKSGEDQAGAPSSSDPTQQKAVASEAVASEAVASEAAATETTTKTGPRELLAQFWAWVVGVFSTLTIFHQRARKLKALKAECESDASNPEKEATYLAELGKHDPAGVVKRFETNKHPSNSDCVVEYLRALVASGNLAKYHSEAAEEGNQMALKILLSGLQKRAEGDREAPITPGESPKAPLHVVMMQSPEANRPFRWLQDLLWSIALMIAMSVVWVAGTSAMRKYARAGGAAPVGSSSSVQAPSSYSPKEYNKENLPEKSVKTFADVKGCDEAKAELEEIVQYLKNPAKFTRLGGTLPKGVLLTGPPGTGKTLLARAVAGAAGVPFFAAAASNFDEMYVGVGSSRVRELFKKARESAPSVIFIDEIDALGGRKNTSGAKYDNQTLNQLLTEMDGFEQGGAARGKEVIVLGATNTPESMDAALKRPGRFDRSVTVGRPDAAGRLEVLGVHARRSGVRLLPGTDLAVVARRTMGFTGAGLQGLLNEAALLAARERAEAVGPEHLQEGIERVTGGIKRASFMLPVRERLTVAIHECGHALVGAAVAAERQRAETRMEAKDQWFLQTLNRAEADERAGTGATKSGTLDHIEDAGPRRMAGLPTKVSIVPRGDAAAGYTLTLPEEDQYL
mmetsp:Transcript_34579/g.75573  ORF Transcript_34579/g.75573 Transcript_34579/m.75573 type:complete len:748 (-) Transcript_34579:26-2269(-)